jgi:hypothetical protein
MEMHTETEQASMVRSAQRSLSWHTCISSLLLRLALVIVLASAEAVHAQQEFCWTMAPFVDELRVLIDQPDPVLGFYGVRVAWIGLDVYHLDGAGAASLVPVLRLNAKTEKYNVGPGLARIDMSFQTHNGTGFFEGNQAATFNASIGAYTFKGLWNFTFTGQNGAPFTNRGELVYHTCGEAPAELQVMRALEAPQLSGASR